LGGGAIFENLLEIDTLVPQFLLEEPRKFLPDHFAAISA
jgi:hypothetical protein